MENYFCGGHKNNWKHIQHFKLLFFKLNLYFDTSKYIYSCRKLNLLLVNSTYLIVSALLKQRRRIQTKVHFKFCYSVRIGTTQKPLKIAVAKKISSNMYVIDETSLQWMFPIPCGNWKTLLLTKVCRYNEILSTAKFMLSLKQVFWKKSVFYIFYLHSAVVIMVKC